MSVVAVVIRGGGRANSHARTEPHAREMINEGR